MQQVPSSITLRRFRNEVVRRFVSPGFGANVRKIRPQTRVAKQRRILENVFAGHRSAWSPAATDIGSILRIANLLCVTGGGAFLHVYLAPRTRVNHGIALSFVRILVLVEPADLDLRDQNQCDARDGKGAEDDAKEVRRTTH